MERAPRAVNRLAGAPSALPRGPRRFMLRALAMLTADVRFEGFGADDWTRVLALVAPGHDSADDGRAGEPRGGLLALHDGARVVKLVHTLAGRLDPRGEPWPVPARELAERHRARWALVAARGALDELLDRFAARLRRDDDLVTQSLSFVRVARELADEGAIEVFPRRFERTPLPSPSLVRGALDALCPAGQVVLVGAFDDGELSTAVALRRDDAGVSRIVGPESLRPRMGPIGGDFRRDYRWLVRAAEEAVGPVALGLFGETATLRSLRLAREPGAFARAVAVRDVVLTPIPPGLVVGLGLDAALAGVALAREALATSATLDALRRALAR